MNPSPKMFRHLMYGWLALSGFAWLGWGSPQQLFAADLPAEVSRFTRTYCHQCHNTEVAKGELDLTAYRSTAEVTASFRRWQNIIDFVRDGEMPPEKYRQPTIPEVNLFVEAVERILLTAALKNAGDPGVVLPRRLTNTEYDLSVEALTGIPIHPTRDFPADPAGGEGFDNTGEALTMSPNLLKKYLTAAERVSHHLVLKPDGITFAPFPVTSYNERKRLTEQAIIDFYQQRSVDVRKYVEAAWRYHHRADSQQDIASWARQEAPELSVKYLQRVYDLLTAAREDEPFLGQLARLWRAIPQPAADGRTPRELDSLLKWIQLGRDTFPPQRQQLIRSNAGNWPISHLDFRARTAEARDSFDTSRLAPFALLKSPRIAASGDPSDDAHVIVEFTSAFDQAGDAVLIKRPIFSRNSGLPKNDKQRMEHEVEPLWDVLQSVAPDLCETLPFVPATDGSEERWLRVVTPAKLEIPLTPELRRRVAEKHLLLQCELVTSNTPPTAVWARLDVGRPATANADPPTHLLAPPSEKNFQSLRDPISRFCDVFPNRFFYVDPNRGLAAGFHLVEGFFRDDLPLRTKVLDDEENRELDRLWTELDFVTQSHETLIRGFVWFERSERHVLHDERFDFLRPEDPELTSNALLDKFEKLYLDKQGIPRRGDTLQPQKPSEKYDMIHGFFERIRSGLRRHEQQSQQAESLGLADLESLAERAFRRRLLPSERTSFQELYQRLRRERQSEEESLRGVLIAILMSPDFCYRYRTKADGHGIQPLADRELASRLSYFLWSSLPDEELLAAAELGKLQDPAQLKSQTRRMLRDPRVEAFAREFLGQWLRYRDFLENDPIQGESFAGYTDELRTAMLEEPTRLATHLIQRDAAVLELLRSDYTFVNEQLARHYGGNIEAQYRRQRVEGEPWVQVNGLHEQGRGGLFGMAVVLTSNSSGERTSPVKRGFWSVHHLLGQQFPPPPADVPELPDSDKEGDKPLRELLKLHVSDAQCALCHTHFDSLGLAMEGFDPIGRARTTDGAGRPVDDRATLPDGRTARGIPELIEYIDEQRRDDFIRTLCRKFLGYALGRSVTLSDQPLLAKMERQLAANDYRFSTLFEVVVSSQQFRYKRGQ